jgi:hypothetical protein
MIIRQLVLPLVVLLSFAPVVSGQSKRTPTRPRRSATHQPKHHAPPVITHKVVHKPVSRIDWDEVPIKEIFQWLREQGFENVVPVWRKLRREGVTADTPVTLTMANTAVGKVLSEALDQLSDELRWRVMGNVLRISTRRDFEKDLYTKVYELSKESDDMPDFWPGCSKGLTIGVEESHYTREERLDAVRDMVISTVAPDSWAGNGGVGSIELIYEANSMIVRNTPEVHVMLDSDFRIEDAIPTASQSPERPKPETPLPTK